MTLKITLILSCLTLQIDVGAYSPLLTCTQQNFAVYEKMEPTTTYTETPQFKKNDNNKNWLIFLDHLYDKLSEYEIQKETCKYNVANLRDWGSITKQPGIKIDENNVDDFFKILLKYKLPEDDLVKNKTFTQLELKQLNHVLNITLKYKTLIYCSDHSVIIQSNYIMLSELNFLVAECKVSTDIHIFNLFALNTIFIDSDIEYVNSKNLYNFTVIAPKLQIIGNRDIRLVGAAAEKMDYEFKPGIVAKGPGTPGLPGEPGTPGGSFFGFAYQILNDKSLTIDVSGGDGGNGQWGGNGAPGSDGLKARPEKHNPYPPDNDICESGNKFETTLEDGNSYRFSCDKSYDWKQREGGTDWVTSNHNCNKIYWTTTRTIVMLGDCEMCKSRECCLFHIYGIMGQKGGDGGDSGKGGIGGSKGNIFILTAHTSNINLIDNMGKNGQPGRGGMGGQGGLQYTSEYKVCSWFGRDKKIFWEHQYDEIKEQSSNGTEGVQGKNENNIRQPTSPILNEPMVYLNLYKLFYTGDMYDHYHSPHLDFFFEFINNETLNRGLITGTSLFDELEGLEKLFYKLNTVVDFLPLYESLLKLIKLYAAKLPGTKSYKVEKYACAYLHVAVLTKINSFKYDTLLIKDINEFFKSLVENFKDLKQLKKENKDVLAVVDKIKNINNAKESYNENINEKIREADILITNNIMPKFDLISQDIEKYIQSILTQIRNLHHENKKHIKELEEKKKQILKWGILGTILSYIKNVVAPVLSAMGPIGAMVGAVVGVAANVGKQFLPGTSTEPRTDLVIDTQAMVSGIKSMQQIKLNADIKKLQNGIDQLNQIPKQAKIGKKELDGLRQLTGSSTSITNLTQIRGKITQLLNKKKEAFKNNEQYSKDIDIAKKTFEVASTVLNGVLPVVNEALKVASDYSEINKQIEETKQRLKSLEVLEKEVENNMGPSLQSMVSEVKNASEALKNHSAAHLDIAKYGLKDMLENLKVSMKKSIGTFKESDDIIRSLNSLYDAFDTIVCVYQRIQTYQEQQQTAGVVSDLASIIVSTDVPTIYEQKISYLEVLISSNFIKQQLTTAYDAIKQFVFPFANMYFENFKLPTDLEFDNSIETLLDESLKQVLFIKAKLDEYKYSIRDFDGAFGTGWFDSKFNGSQPFFVWKNELDGFIISQLLSGKEVILKANILDSLVKFEAMKFKNIKIKLKSKDIKQQAHLDQILSAFAISMTHMGDSYYQYDSKIYLIEGKNLELWYSFEIVSDEEPMYKNEIYRKINQGDFMLSPYATWKVKLNVLTPNRNNLSFKHLENFKNKIDLELCGVGFFVRPNERPNLNIYMDHYYKPVKYVFSAKTKRDIVQEKMFVFSAWYRYPNDTISTTKKIRFSLKQTSIYVNIPIDKIDNRLILLLTCIAIVVIIVISTAMISFL